MYWQYEKTTDTSPKVLDRFTSNIYIYGQEMCIICIKTVRSFSNSLLACILLYISEE